MKTMDLDPNNPAALDLMKKTYEKINEPQPE